MSFPIGAIFGLGEKLIDRLWPDPEQRDKALLELRRLEQSGELAQIAVNLEEAKSESLFVAGWRPFVGWVCASAFAYHYVLVAFIEYIISMFAPETPAPPQIDLADMLPVLLGMLGLGGLRTYEKATGTNKNR